MWRTQAHLSHGHHAVPSTPISQVRKLRSTREVNSYAQSHTALRGKMRFKSCLALKVKFLIAILYSVKMPVFRVYQIKATT